MRRTRAVEVSTQAVSPVSILATGAAAGAGAGVPGAGAGLTAGGPAGGAWARAGPAARAVTRARRPRVASREESRRCEDTGAYPFSRSAVGIPPTGRRRAGGWTLEG